MNTVNGTKWTGFYIDRDCSTKNEKLGHTVTNYKDIMKEIARTNPNHWWGTDIFVTTREGTVEPPLINYYTINEKKYNAPYQSNNCYVADVEGAQAALAKLKVEADSIDYTGMSDGEIFVTVFDRYAQQFGNKFLEVRWQQCIIDKQKIDRENKEMPYTITSQFYKELSQLGVDRHEGYSYFYGYEGMSKEQMKTAIYSEFATTGTTYAAYYKMVDKLELTGLVNQQEASSLRDAIRITQLQKNEPPITELFYEKYSDELAGYYTGMDLDEIFGIWDDVVKRRTYHGLNADKQKAADEKARDIIGELNKLMKANNIN